MPVVAFAPEYEIYFFDHNGVRSFLLTNWEYLEYSQRVSSPWNYIIRLEMSYLDPQVDTLRNTLSRDFYIEVYRSDEITGARTKVYEGLHRTIVEQTKQSGSLVITLYGTGYTQLIARRIVIPDAGQEHKTYVGPAETVLKSFVNSQMISPTDLNRVTTGLTNQVNLATGSTAEYSARYTNLMTVCASVAEQGEVDFGIVGGTNVGDLEFRVVPLWGDDRRVGNTAGNVPTVFDIFLHNMDIPIRSLRGIDEVNVVYVGGANAGTLRDITEIATSAATFSPLARSEAFVDARQESTADGYQTAGQNYLNTHEVKNELSFNIIQTEGTRWLRDWNLGDIITAKYFDLTFTKKIVEVRVVVSAGATGSTATEIISAEMEEVA